MQGWLSPSRDQTRNAYITVATVNKLVESGRLSHGDGAERGGQWRLGGAAPLVFSNGAGAEAHAQIGWVIVGGMTLGTLLTLLVVPAFYTIFARNHQFVPGAASKAVATPAAVLHQQHGDD